MKLSHFLSALLGAFVVAVLVAALALGGAFDTDDDPAGGSQSPAASTAPSTTPASTGAGAQNVTDVSALYEQIKDGVVSVQVRTERQTPLDPRGGGGAGSGFVLDEEGHILTNQHVVDDADRVQVRIGESERLVRARVLGADPSSDLAVLKVDPEQAGELQPLELGSSKDARVGAPAIAIGSPFGLEGSLTTGVVSAQGRPIRAPNGFTIEGALQTDAAINPGNSGGPLLDARGRVIGINAQIATGGSPSNSGVGFAIPIDTAKEVVPALKRGERIRRAYLGVSSGDSESGDGAVIAEVRPGGPAARAGLRADDRILRIGDTDVQDSEDVVSAVAEREPGDRVPIVVERDGDRRTVQVTLGTRPQQVRP